MAKIIIFPVRVQGEGAYLEIVEAIKSAQHNKNLDVLIIGRGGGSIEDLWAFNEESVARAIYESVIPVVSAVGHEIDYAISDFVADLRAPTPSAAAELVVPDKNNLMELLKQYSNLLYKALSIKIKNLKKELYYLESSYILRDYINIFTQYKQRIDDIENSLYRMIKIDIEHKKEKIMSLKKRLDILNPYYKIKNNKELLLQCKKRFLREMMFLLEKKKEKQSFLASQMKALSPLNVLSRGYSITFDVKHGGVIKSVNDVSTGMPVEVRLHDGSIYVEVKDVETS